MCCAHVDAVVSLVRLCRPVLVHTGLIQLLVQWLDATGFLSCLVLHANAAVFFRESGGICFELVVGVVVAFDQPQIEVECESVCDACLTLPPPPKRVKHLSSAHRKAGPPS